MKVMWSIANMGLAMGFGFGLFGCATPQQTSEVPRIVPITCGSRDCGIKWARALQWVSENAAYKIRIANDSIITTEGPLDSATESAITINKVPKGDGTSDIIFKSNCANWIGCIPTHDELLGRFTAFVDGPPQPPPR